TPAEVRAILFDGFFPETPADAEPARAGRAGLHEMGLPYVHDPAVTRHLAAFLRRHGPQNASIDAILFNGGVFQPAAMRQRLVDVMRPWYPPEWQPLVLTTPSLDLAVAWGAASYAWLRHTGGRRIGGGIARSYYVGVDRKAASGFATVLCLVPRHMEEDNEIVISQPELELTLCQPVLFPLYTSTVRDDKPGRVLTV